MPRALCILYQRPFLKGEEVLITSVKCLFSPIIKESLCHLLDVCTISPDSDSVNMESSE